MMRSPRFALSLGRPLALAVATGLWLGIPPLVDGQDVRDRNQNIRVPDPLQNPATLTRRAPVERRWRLGINVQDTEAGCVITNVVPNSPASRAGLSVGDSIINVDGYQVGYVNGVLYDCGDEFQRRADARGYIRLLVWSSTHQLLFNRTVRMEPLIAFVPPPNTATVSGQILYRERIAFPRDAVTEVRLTYQLPDQLPVVVAEQTLDQPLPANYQLAYSAAAVPRNVPLQVEAQVWERGRLRWEGRAPLPAAQPLGNSRVDVSLIAPSRVR